MGRELAGGPTQSFDEQFARREEVGPLSVVDLVPQNQTSPTVYFNLGWYSQISDYETSLRLAFNSGRRVLSAELPEEPEEQKADRILRLFDTKNIRKAHIVAHSVGAISAARAVLKDSTIVEKLALINPAGLIPDDTPEELIRRYKDLLRQFKGFVRTSERGSRQRIRDMADTITGFDMNEALGKIADKVKVLVVQAEDDGLFPKGRTVVDGRAQRFTVPGGHYSVDQAMRLALQSM